MSQPSAQTSRGDFAAASRWTALIAGGVCLFIITLMVLTLRQDIRLAPLNSPQIATLKEQLADRSNDAQLKTEIRERDKVLRAGYFARQQLLKRGGWLLVAAGAALAIALKSHSTLTRKATMPDIQRSDTWREMKLARMGVALSGVILVAVCGGLLLLAKPDIPEAKTEEVANVPPASAAELAANWVSFRGPTGNGVVTGSAPESWDGDKGTGIVWKTPVSLPGHGSPIVFGGNVFLSGSDGNLQELMCFDAASGKLKWHSAVPRGTLQNPNVFDDTGYAASTPVTDGARVYAIFATGDIGAFDLAGKKVWAKSVSAPESQYGFASSLALSDGKVIIQWDQGSDAEAGKSALICLDGPSGRQLWKTARPVVNSWSSPTVVNGVIYTASMPWVIAYNVADGTEIWRAKLLDGDVAPTPVWREGVLYIANDRALAAAIRTDGTGDVTETHVKWKNSDVPLPDMASPLTDGKHLLLITGGGDLNCLSTADGKLLWNHDLNGMVHGSPILVGKTVYLTDHDGVTHMFDLADTFTSEKTMPLGEQVSASPAVVGGRMYIRGKESLYCIGAGAPK